MEDTSSSVVIACVHCWWLVVVAVLGVVATMVAFFVRVAFRFKCAIARCMMTDERRRAFLDALENVDSGVEVSRWEAEFLNSNMETERFSARQRNSIDKMIERYGHRLSGKW